MVDLNLNEKLLQYCVENQERFSDCKDIKSMKRRLDSALDAITVDVSNLSVTDLHIVQIVMGEVVGEGVNTEHVAEEYFRYLDKSVSYSTPVK